MKKSLKGALLSGVLYPGLGQIALGRPLRGLLFLAVVSAALAAIVAKTARQAYAILEKTESDGHAVDLVAIVTNAQASSLTDRAVEWALAVLVAGWILSVVDAFLLGDRMDRGERARPGARPGPPPPGEAPKSRAAGQNRKEPPAGRLTRP